MVQVHFLRGSGGQVVPSSVQAGAPRTIWGGASGNRLAHFAGWESATSVPCTAGVTADPALGTSIASPVLATIPGLAQFVPALTLRRGDDGPQIVVTWVAPVAAGSVTSIRVIRRQVTYPANESDGTILYSGTPATASFADLQVPPGECTFYAVWAQVSTLGNRWVTHPQGRGEEIPIQTGFWGPQLLRMMGDVYTDVESACIAEKAPDTSTLEQTQADAGAVTGAPIDKEEFNFGTIPKTGALGKYLAIIGPYLDEIDGLIHALSDQFDPRLACSKFLPKIAEEIGFKLNTELTVDAQRREILGRLKYLQSKGTSTAIASLILDVSGLVARVEELCDRIIISADVRRFGPPRPEDGTDPGTWGAPPGPLGLRGVSVVVSIPCIGFCLDDATGRKLLRVVTNAVAVCTGLEVILEDENCTSSVGEVTADVEDLETF